MDVLRMDRTTFIPDKLIENYSSMIWTERYLEAGDFELKTAKISATWNSLPEMSLITLRDTDEVMFVESRSIGKNSEGFPELTITGRSLDAFAEHRYLEGPYIKTKYKMAREYTAAEAALVLLWNSFVNPSVNDVTRIGPWIRSDRDKISNTVVTDSVNVVGTRKRRWLEGGQVYSQIIDFLRQDKLGIRMIRPESNPFQIASVSTGDKGIISYDNPTSTDKLRFDIYNGDDRRRQQSINEPVIFHYNASHIEDPSYLFSVADYKTMAYVISDVGIKKVYRAGAGETTVEGLDRRVIWIDGGGPEFNETEPTELLEWPVLNDAEPSGNTTQAMINAENNATIAEWRVDNDAIRAANAAVRAENNAIKAEFLEDLPEAGDIALEKHERVELFEGTISTEAPYKYNQDYFLGDKITLLAEYDFDLTMRVSEYIRTEDIEGDRGYPGLVVAL